MTTGIFFAPLILQGAVMIIDELHCHRRRILPLWEKIGHPIDTLSLLAVWGFALLRNPTPSSLAVYALLGAISCLIVTKDEAVHAQACTALEHWLHSLLFILHPLCVIAVGVLWYRGGSQAHGVLMSLIILTSLFLAYQVVYWNYPRRIRRIVDNSIYHALKARWYEAEDDPVALLRAESRLRNPWIDSVIREANPSAPAEILDIGCGGGFLSNAMAERGHRVTAIDLSDSSLEIARQYDRTGSVNYSAGDALLLQFPDSAFDAVTVMDFLEHVDDPAAVIFEASRVLRPGGLFFFHTFNRNWFSKLLIIHFVEWFVKNTPKDLHVIHLFLRPEELKLLCQKAGLRVAAIRGMRPVLWSKNTFKILMTGRVPPGFSFKFCPSLLGAYCGYAVKEELDPGKFKGRYVKERSPPWIPPTSPARQRGTLSGRFGMLRFLIQC